MIFRLSCAGWVDRLPEHWKEARARFVAAVNPTKSEVSHLDEGVEVTFVPMEAVSEDGTIDTSRRRTLGEVAAGYTYFIDGDILVAKITPCFENGKAAQAVGLTNGIGFGSTEFHVLRARRGLDRQFLLHLVRSAPFREFGTASMYGAGGQKRVPTEFVMDFVIPLPPPDEQRAIADFLDRETAKIDTLIATQERLIALLDEKRQATITHAVTKGLDPNAPMKESGVEWLGQAPAHWSVCALSYRYEVSLGKMLDEKRISGEFLAPYLRNVDVQWARINITDLPVMDFAGDDLVRYALRPGDLLVCEGGEVGRAAVWQGQLDSCFYQKALHRLRARNENIDSAQFLFFVLFWAAKLGVFVGSEGSSTIAHLPAEAFRRYRFAFPPIGEQEAIVRHLDHVLSKFDHLRNRSETVIERLRERRTALITAAVTGQIDVSRPTITEAAE